MIGRILIIWIYARMVLVSMYDLVVLILLACMPLSIVQGLFFHILLTYLRYVKSKDQLCQVAKVLLGIFKGAAVCENYFISHKPPISRKPPHLKILATKLLARNFCVFSS